VQLATITAPESEYDNSDKGEVGLREAVLAAVQLPVKLMVSSHHVCCNVLCGVHSRAGNAGQGQPLMLRTCLVVCDGSQLVALQALHAFELALSLEKLNYQKLWHLDDIATKAEDYEMASMVEEMLHNQVTSMHTSRPTVCANVPVIVNVWLLRKQRSLQQSNDLARRATLCLMRRLRRSSARQTRYRSFGESARVLASSSLTGLSPMQRRRRRVSCIGVSSSFFV